MSCPGCGAPLETRDFDGRTQVDFCPSCFGVWYDLADLALSLELAEGRQGQRRCPRDGKAMVVGRLEGTKVEADRCLTCGGFYLDSGEVQKLREALGVDKLVGEKGSVPPLPAPGASTAHPSPKPPKPRREKEQARTPEPRDSSSSSNPDEAQAPVVLREGRHYRHFQTSWPKVTYVLGEFPWQARVGDEAKARDFIAPPFLLSQEVTDSDKTWSHGEYLEPAEVWAGFGLPGDPPERRSAGPAQPNPHDESWTFLRVWGSLAGVAAVALFSFLAMRALNMEVLSQEYAVDLASPNPEHAFVTHEFNLPGGPSSVRVDLETNVTNNWAFIRLALIDAETGTATHFEREVAYYYGSDDGESWSEGSRTDTVYLPKVPPGRYYMHVDPEASASFTMRLIVTRDSPRILYLFVAMALLMLPFGWTWARHHTFEVGRWTESDHPMSSASDDEDDE
ncbi:MAG: putative membrane protein [Elusimicrobia bacterium]|nr:MAG: putative membrane protein [Elusimicrobiota bacterium]